jgi:hypothetical protein
VEGEYNNAYPNVLDFYFKDREMSLESFVNIKSSGFAFMKLPTCSPWTVVCSSMLQVFNP